MKRLPVYCLALAALVLPTHPGAAPVEDLFKWGEYDSLIRTLDPVVSRPGFSASIISQADSVNQAKSFLFLGVAFFATSKPDRSDQAFTMACSLDSNVKLDRFYVSEEIAQRFEAIAKELRLRRRQQCAATAQRPSGNARSAQPSPPRLVSRDQKTWLWWGLGVTALVAAGSGAYWYASQTEAPDNVTTIDIRKQE